MTQADVTVAAKSHRASNFTRNHGGPSQPSRAPGRLVPPPPPAAAMKLRAETDTIKPQPITSLMPWETTAMPLQPAAEKSTSFWSRVLGAGIGAGLLVSAGYVLALVSQQPSSPSLAEVRPRALAMPVADLQEETLLPAPDLGQPLAAAEDEMNAARPEAGKAESKRTRFGRVIGSRATRSAHAMRKTGSARESTITVPASTAAESSKVAIAKTTKKGAARKAAQQSTGPLPEQPTRTEVQSGIEHVRPALAACVQGAHGVTNAQITIVGAGRVSHSVIDGTFVGTPTGSCIARALRTASFPEFSGAPFTVHYPFSF
ncbi:MAG: hypothetical protein ABW321_08580 [Polyangiales bacterium]